MCFLKRNRFLNTTILSQWCLDALKNLDFVGGWDGYWATRIEGIKYRSERVSGFNAVVGDCGTFIQDALIDRAKIKRNPKKFSKELDICASSGWRYVNSKGEVTQFNSYGW